MSEVEVRAPASLEIPSTSALERAGGQDAGQRERARSQLVAGVGTQRLVLGQGAGALEEGLVAGAVREHRADHQALLQQPARELGQLLEVAPGVGPQQLG